jgi:hypothetical protein
LAASDKIHEYLLTDRVVGLYGPNQELHRVELARTEVNHAPILQAMISEALERGACYRRVEPGLHYIVDTCEDIEGFIPVLEAIAGKAQVCMVNMLKRKNTAYYPFTLSISGPEHLFAFYNGEFIITIVVDLDHISRYFKNRGFTVSFHHDEPWFLAVNNEDPAVHQASALKISAHLWDRIFAEFLSLDWLLSEIAGKYERMNALANRGNGPPA